MKNPWQRNCLYYTLHFTIKPTLPLTKSDYLIKRFFFVSTKDNLLSTFNGVIRINLEKTLKYINNSFPKSRLYLSGWLERHGHKLWQQLITLSSKLIQILHNIEFKRAYKSNEVIFTVSHNQNSDRNLNKIMITKLIWWSFGWRIKKSC